MGDSPTEPGAPAPPLRPDGLQLAEDRGLQERIWIAERIAHCAIVLLTALALTGLLGSGGPLARQSARAAEGEFTLPRIWHTGTPEQLHIRFAEPAATHTLILASPSFAELTIEAIQPLPVESRAMADGIALRFDSAPGPAAVALELRADRPGPVALSVALDAGKSHRVVSFVMP